jgi:hypothetical protein
MWFLGESTPLPNHSQPDRSVESPLYSLHQLVHQTSLYHILRQTVPDGDPRGLNTDLSVKMKDNLIGEEIQHSWPNYNHSGTLRLSDRYTNSCGLHDLVEDDNPATRAPVIQAIEELARTSTEL